MQPTHRDTTSETTQPALISPPDLGLTMTRILQNPLAALRCSMENLARELPSGDPHTAQVKAALDEVVRLSRGVQDIVDYTAPREIRPLACTTDELLFSTLRMLPESAHARLRIARAKVPQKLIVDGPQLCQALRHLADYALASTSGEVLFGTRQDSDETLFTLVGAASNPTTTKSIQLNLGLHLAGRDIPRLGGTLNLQHSARGAICIQVSFSRTWREGSAA